MYCCPVAHLNQALRGRLAEIDKIYFRIEIINFDYMP